ncbi:MAG: hypothetical protein PHW60_10140 [Kiritimatiellae bacterium]|nr:hypothetical protein [Kiritimatiellia bacterium]
MILPSCFRVSSDALVITAGRFVRRWRLGPQGAVTEALQMVDWNVPLAPRTGPECYYDGLLRLFMRRSTPVFPELHPYGEPRSARMIGAGFEAECDRLEMSWREPGQAIRLSRSWQVFPGTEAIAAGAAIASDSAPQLEFGRGDYLNVIDTLPVDLTDWDVCAVSFFGRTDSTNDLVRHRQLRVGADADPEWVAGNLLFLEPPGGGRGLFVLLESPPSDERRVEVQAEFLISPHGVCIVGWGIAPHEIRSVRLRRSYSVAVGGYIGGEAERLRALRTFIKACYPTAPARQTLVANPWGDGQCYENLGEPFILKELEACAALGLTHYQVDDGWQAGGTLAELSIKNIARPRSFWDIHAGKFPRGFAPLAEAAARLGVHLSLWFAPDTSRHYHTWREESKLLLEMHRRYGINLFKIDNVWLRTKDAEENLKALLESVIRGSDGRVAFNLDATNGRRLGYFAMLRYGNIFIENRYVRAGRAQRANTYVPWRVLRNLWNLARYLPAERLQFEFPNRHKPIYKTAADVLEAFEMQECRDDYLAAIAMFSSPLCWCEPSALPAAARADIARVMALHGRLQGDLARSHILPVGEEPTGHSWTGLQASDPERPGQGWLLVFREATDAGLFEFALWEPAGATIRLECRSHPEPAGLAMEAAHVRIRIPRPNDFRLFRYTPA